MSAEECLQLYYKKVQKLRNKTENFNSWVDNEHKDITHQLSIALSCDELLNSVSDEGTVYRKARNRRLGYALQQCSELIGRLKGRGLTDDDQLMIQAKNQLREIKQLSDLWELTDYFG